MVNKKREQEIKERYKQEKKKHTGSTRIPDPLPKTKAHREEASFQSVPDKQLKGKASPEEIIAKFFTKPVKKGP